MHNTVILRRLRSGRGRAAAAATSCLAVAAGTLIAVAPSAHATPSALPDVTDGVKGVAYATIQSGNRIYVGGSFSWAGPYTGGGAPVDPSTGQRVTTPKINGTVNAAVPVGSGGWLVGGTFAFAAGKARANVARISATGTLSTWNPGANGSVTAIAVRGNTAYLGGAFTTVAGQPRAGLAAVTLDTGTVTAWNPSPSAAVNALAVASDGATVYVGTTSGLDAFDATSAAGTGTAPLVAGDVRALALSSDGSALQLGGSFSSVNGTERANLAQVSTADGSVTPWAPDTNGPVSALLASNGLTMVGGAFSTIEGMNRSGLASVSSDGTPTPWSPALTSTGAAPAVDALSTSSDGSTVFVGGEFDAAAGLKRARAAAFDATTAAVTPWDPSADARVSAVARSGSNVFVGGAFSMLNGIPCGNLAAIDAATGRVDRSFAARTNDVVRALATSPDGSTLFVGGAFTMVNGTTGRGRLAAFEASTGAVKTWKANTSGIVFALGVVDTRLVVGGGFATLNGAARNRLGAVDMTTAAVDPTFVPNANAAVRALAISPNGTVYVGGSFTNMGGQPRPGLASVNTVTGAPTAFAPTNGGVVISVALSPDGSRFYGGSTSNRTYAYAPAEQNSPKWTVRSGGDVQGMAASATEVFLGGHFTTFPEQKQARTHLASVSAANGALTAWNPKPDGAFGPWAVTIVPGGLLIGGDFERVAADRQPGFARFTGSTEL